MADEKEKPVVIIGDDDDDDERAYDAVNNVIRETRHENKEEHEQEQVRKRIENTTAQRRWKREDPDVEEEWSSAAPRRRPTRAQPRKVTTTRRRARPTLAQQPRSKLRPRRIREEEEEVEEDDYEVEAGVSPNEEEEEEEEQREIPGYGGGGGIDENDPVDVLAFLEAQGASRPEDVQQYQAQQIARVDAPRKQLRTILWRIVFVCALCLWLTVAFSTKEHRRTLMGHLGFVPMMHITEQFLDQLEVFYFKYVARMLCKPCDTVSPAASSSPPPDPDAPPREFVCGHNVGEHTLWTRGEYLNVTKAAVDLHTSSTYTRGEKDAVPPVSESELRTGLVGSVPIARIASMLVGTFLRPTMVALKDKTVLCMHEVRHGLPNSGDRRICVVRRHLGNNFLILINPELVGWSTEEHSTVVLEYPLACKKTQKPRVRRDVIEMTYTTIIPLAPSSSSNRIPVRMRATFLDGTEAQQLQHMYEEMRGAYVCDPPVPPQQQHQQQQQQQQQE